jgi:hypothetical protein
MLERNALAERWIGLWNEPDDETRRKAVEELFALEATYLMFNQDAFVGHDAIFRQITLAHYIYGPRGFLFKPQNNALGHHNVVRFGWAMLNAESGETDMLGTDVLVLDHEGRIAADYQFHDKLTSIRYDLLPYPDEMVPIPGFFTPAQTATYRQVWDRMRTTPPRI